MLQLMCGALYFSAFLLNAVATKSIKNYQRKICSDLARKMFVKLTPGEVGGQQGVGFHFYHVKNHLKLFQLKLN
jgi:hypothetical protein